MRLLFDENLPRSVVRDLGGVFPGSAHVAQFDLLRVSDDEIWRFASENGFAIVSKDRDFASLAILRGPIPKAIWLRIGNCSRGDIVDLILGNADVIRSFELDPTTALLVIPPGLTT